MSIFVNLSVESGGIGDAITNLPAFRLLKQQNPDQDIVLFTYDSYVSVYNQCKYIDYILPIGMLYIEGDKTLTRNHNGLRISESDTIINASHNFYERHEQHIVKSVMKHMNLDYDDNTDFSYEFNNVDEVAIQEEQKVLLKMADGKPLVAIGPAVTMYSRMYRPSSWQRLVDLLRKDYFVVSIGGPDDLPIDVDYNALGKYPVTQIPGILDIFEGVFVVNSGMMHIASVNQNVHMVKISVGQFPPELITPYRAGKWAGNTTVVRHSCPLMEQCFKNHINETSINKQMMNFVSKTKISDPSLLKYICWNYCDKDEDKFSCDQIEPERVYEEFKNAKF